MPCRDCKIALKRESLKNENPFAISGQRYFEAHSTLTSYFVLSGIWFIIAIAYGLLDLKRPESNCLGVAILVFLIGLLWVIWLRGFRLRFTSGKIEYRNGLYKSVAVSLKEITGVRNSWIGFKRSGQTIKIPRLVITYGTEANALAINAKPFRRQDIHLLMELLQEAAKLVCE